MAKHSGWWVPKGNSDKFKKNLPNPYGRLKRLSNNKNFLLNSSLAFQLWMIKPDRSYAKNATEGCHNIRFCTWFCNRNLWRAMLRFFQHCCGSPFSDPSWRYRGGESLNVPVELRLKWQLKSLKIDENLYSQPPWSSLSNIDQLIIIDYIDWNQLHRLSVFMDWTRRNVHKVRWKTFDRFCTDLIWRTFLTKKYGNFAFWGENDGC